MDRERGFEKVVQSFPRYLMETNDLNEKVIT